MGECVLLLGIISAALLGMQTYMRRGIQGVVKTATDELGRQQDSAELDPVKGSKENAYTHTVANGKKDINDQTGTVGIRFSWEEKNSNTVARSEYTTEADE